MKKTILLSTIFTLLAFLMIGTTSCNKFKRKPADQIIGDYIGSGTDVNENPFISQVVRITKVSDTRVRVAPVGHSYITAFEVDIEGTKTQITSSNDASGSLAADIDGESITLAFTSPQEETFGGQKQ